MQLFGSGLLVDGERYFEYFFQQWNRVRVQVRREGLKREGLGRGRFKGMFGSGRGGGCKVFHEVAL